MRLPDVERDDTSRGTGVQSDGLSQLAEDTKRTCLVCKHCDTGTRPSFEGARCEGILQRIAKGQPCLGNFTM